MQLSKEVKDSSFLAVLCTAQHGLYTPNLLPTPMLGTIVVNLIQMFIYCRSGCMHSISLPSLLYHHYDAKLPSILPVCLL